MEKEPCRYKSCENHRQYSSISDIERSPCVTCKRFYEDHYKQKPVVLSKRMKVCKVKGCNQRAVGKGLCNKHYGRMRAHGTLDYPKKKLCSVEDCKSPANARGLCTVHYNRYRRTGEVTISEHEKKLCSVEDCKSPAIGNGLCDMHYQRVKRIGTTKLPDRSKTCSIDGCERLYHANGFCSLHYGRNRRNGTPYLKKELFCGPVQGYYEGEGT